MNAPVPTVLTVNDVLRDSQVEAVIDELERDLIGLRANIRRDRVYLYPIRATPAQARAMFVSMLQRLGIEADKFGSSTGTLTGLEMS